MATCRSCGAEIIWAITPNGKRIPMDAAPVSIPRGLYTLLLWPEDGHTDATPVPPVHQSHFATCPNADEHRRG